MESAWNVSARYVDTDLERPRWRFTANYRIWRTLQAGAEFNPAAREIGPLVTWYLFTETPQWPAVFVGTSSDRIGSPPGKQSYYVTLAKHLPHTPLSLYASLNYSEWQSGYNFPFGGNLNLPFNFSVRPMYDGRRSHLVVTHFYRRHSFSVLYIWLEKIGVSYAVGF